MSDQTLPVQPSQALDAQDAARYRWLRTYHVDSYLANGSLEKLDDELRAAINARGDV